MRRLLSLVGSAILLVAAIVLAVILFKPWIGPGWLRAEIERRLNEAAGVSVSLESAAVQISLRPRVRLRGVAVESAAPAVGSVTVDSFEFDLDLVRLLRGQIPARSARLEGLELPVIGSATEDRSVAGGGSEAPRLVVRISHAEADLDDQVGLHLVASGFVERAGFDLQVSAPSADSSSVEDLRAGLAGPLMTAIRLPDLETEIAGIVSVDRRQIEISELEGEVTGTAVEGSLTVDLAPETPWVGGRLAIDRIDLGSLLHSHGRPSEVEAKSGVLADLPIQWQRMRSLDGKVEFDVREVAGLGVEVAELVVRAAFDGGELESSLSARMAGNPLQGKLTVETPEVGIPDVVHPTASAPEIGERQLTLKVGAEDLSPTSVDQLLTAAAGLAGFEVLGREGLDLAVGMGRLSATLGTIGETPRELIDNLSIRLSAHDVDVHDASQDDHWRLDLLVRELELESPVDGKLQATVLGELRGQRFTLSAVGADPLNREMGAPWPIELRASGFGTEVEVTGWFESIGDGPSAELEVTLEGDSLGGLEPLVGVSAAADLEYLIGGRLTLTPGRRRLDLDLKRLGNSSLIVHLDIPPTGPARVEVDATTIDLPELSLLLDPANESTIPRKDMAVDLAALLSRVLLRDSEVDLSVDRLPHEPADIADLSASLRVSDGRLEASPFALHLGDTRLSGTIAAEIAEDVPVVELELSAEDVALSDLVDRDALPWALDGAAASIAMSVSARGESLDEILASGGRLEAELAGLALSVVEPATAREVLIDLNRARVLATSGGSLEGEVIGTLDDAPFQLVVDSDLLRPDGKEVDRLRLRFSTHSDRFQTEVSGELTSVGEGKRVAFDVSLDLVEGEPEPPSGASSTSRVRPFGGPWRLTGGIEREGSQYRLQDGRLQFGESSLTGEGTVDLSETPPSVVLDLAGDRVRLEDLLPQREVPSEGDSSPSPRFEAPLPQLLEKLNRVMDAVGRKMRAEMSLEVEELDLADHPTGPLSFDASLSRDRLAVEGLRLGVSEGLVEGRAELVRLPADWRMALDLHIDGLDYEPILKWLDPESEHGGSMALDSSLRGRAATLDEMVASLDGHFDFSLYPRDFSAQVLDLWASGLILSMLNVYGRDSVLNCVVGAFDLEGGEAVAEQFWLDTSGMRVRGRGKLDFRSRQIDMRLKPRPKRLSVVNVATPVDLTGDLDNPNLRTAVGGLDRSLLRIATWALTIAQVVFRETLPTDGADICVDPDRRSPLVAAGPSVDSSASN